MTAELFAENQATTTVSSGGTDAPASGTQETWTVASSSMFPSALSTTPGTQFHVADTAAGFTSEIIAVTNVSGTTWTVTRGAETTTPVAHTTGFTIDQVVTTGFLGNVQTSLSVLSPIFSGGADPTGTNDSSAAFQAALNAVPSTGGVVGVPPGVYKVGTALTVPVLQTYIAGAGRAATQINSYVTGDCIRAYGTATANSQTGGGIIGLTIDGTHAGNNSSGIHVGDMYRPVFDQLAVQNFTGTGSKNIWFDNNYSWMEQATGRIWSTNSKNLVVFDNSANTSGGATGTFDRTCMDIFLINEAAGNGVTFQNGAIVDDGKLGVYGNFSAGGRYRLHGPDITGSNAPDGYSRIAGSQLNIGVELAGTAADRPEHDHLRTERHQRIRAATVSSISASTRVRGGNERDQLVLLRGPRQRRLDTAAQQQGTNAFNAGTGLSNVGNIATVNDVITVSPTANPTGMIMPKWGTAPAPQPR